MSLADTQCPKCYAKSRHRALHLLLQGHFASLMVPSGRILEIGPEVYSHRFAKAWPEIQHVALDIKNPWANTKADLTQLPFQASTFHLGICYHVFEHIIDDSSAMSEFFRVLQPGGLALVQVPIKGDHTYEDYTITSLAARERAFGQEDHVRQYGWDIVSRLGDAGFRVESLDAVNVLGSKIVNRYGIRNGEPIFICRKLAEAT
ncbi:MAG: methyltransferase domain-containing protein [Chloroflexota bacterium]